VVKEDSEHNEELNGTKRDEKTDQEQMFGFVQMPRDAGHGVGPGTMNQLFMGGKAL
jgi:hypothetical protein